MTTEVITSAQVNDFDYVIVGGGTAGCVIASRLSDYLPNKKILLIEAGPSDFNDDRVLKLKEWLTLLGGELDYDYGTIEQPNGNIFSSFTRPIPYTKLNQAIHTSDILEPKFSVVAPRIIPWSPSGHLNMIAKSGKAWVAKGGILRPWIVW